MSTKFREVLYLVGAIVPSLLGLIVMFTGIEQGAADHIAQIFAGLVTLLGAAAPATAAVVVRKQTKDGTLTSAPIDKVITGVTEVVKAQQKADQEVERVKELLQGAVVSIPALGPIATQIIEEVPTPTEVLGSLTSAILRK